MNAQEFHGQMQEDPDFKPYSKLCEEPAKVVKAIQNSPMIFWNWMAGAPKRREEE